MATHIWRSTRFDIDLSRPRVMGVVNITPDSFSDAGARASLDAAMAHCDALCEQGADLLDLGGESTRPGAVPVSADEECRRVLPVLRHALTLGVPVSVDTRNAITMRRALDAGADIINDVLALRGDGAEGVLAAHPRAGVCLMHMTGEPQTMQHAPHYDEVVAEVRDFLAARVRRSLDLGIDAQRIVVDPGFGFGKTLAHNIELHRRLAVLVDIGRPVLAGWSRKRALGAITGRPVSDRLAASLAAALSAVRHGALIVRVHDVAQTVDALKVWRALDAAAGEESTGNGTPS
jgi:dihydropteroate synthase